MKKFWLPYSLWDIQGIELWLNEMAAKGYELKRFSRFWSIGRVEFQPSEEAKHCRYRLEPIGKGTKELRERQPTTGSWAGALWSRSASCTPSTAVTTRRPRSCTPTRRA